MIINFAEFGSLWPAPLVPLLPLAATALVGALGTRLLKGASHWPVILGLIGSVICSALVFNAVRHLPAERFAHTYKLYSWIAPASGASFDVSFRIDPLTALMLLMVCTISLLIAVYSRDYMRADDFPERGYERYFAFISLFVFSMCTLVLAGNFLLLYLGWEAVGLCSYLLIGFYYHRPAAAAAAKKAFLVNRIGDFGFGLGILFIYLWISPLVQPGQSALDYTVVFENIRRLDTWQCNTIALLLFCGAVGKSAQFPLYVWLPDAMEGPSPVSALIHAATMVTAGVYMVVRCGAIFVEAPLALAVVASVGILTAFFAAIIAVAQYDMKRILAYSTISQLGFMFLGVGVFAADSAIFHLFTHAFFKALLFLAAGSVMHAMGGIIDIRQFSGLRRILPITCFVFVIGGLALAGFPLLSGFFSKDEIIHAAFAIHPLPGTLAMVTAFLTAFYTFRMIFLAFAGPERVPPGVHAHESGNWMTVPMVLLAVGAIGAGYVGVSWHPGGFAGILEPHGWLHRFLAPVVKPYLEARAAHEGLAGMHGGSAAEDFTMMYVSAGLSILGIAAAYWLYVRRRALAGELRQMLPHLAAVFHNKFYVDELYDWAIVRPLRLGGSLLYGFDRFFIDGLVWLVTAVPRTIGFLLRGFQNGALQSYGVTMTAGMIILVLIAWLTI